MPLFSVVLIARNESKTLPRLVKSLEDFQKRGGEIVLVDTGSTDGTPAIARELGCKVFEEGTRFITTIGMEQANLINDRFVVKWEENVIKEGDTLFDYSAARNYAASLASNDMVAMPDCDEMFTKLDVDAIDRAITEGTERFEYNFVFSHDQYGKEVIKFLHSKFYNRQKAKWVGIIHEVLSGATQTKFYGEDVIKLEHWQNPTTNRTGYLKGLALDCYLNPKTDRNSHYFGRELLWTGRPKSAIKELRRHIAMNAWPMEVAQSMIYIGDAHITLLKCREGLQAYHEAFLMDGTRREALIRLATYFWKLNDYHHTAAYAQAALAIPWAPAYCNNAAEYAQVPHELLYWALWYLGDKEGSKLHWQKALSYQPDNPKYKADGQFYEAPMPLLYSQIYNHPKVSIVIPTLGREEKLQRCLEMIKANAEYDNYEVIVKQDDFPPNNIGVPKLVKQGVAESTGELVMYLGNDCLPQPGFLRLAVEAMVVHFPNLDGLISLNDAYWHGEVATHWLASKKLLPLLDGEFFHTGYHHLGCDNELTERCIEAGRFFWAENAKVLHDHPLNNSGKQMAYQDISNVDEVYKLAYNEKTREEDFKLLLKRNADRRAKINIADFDAVVKRENEKKRENEHKQYLADLEKNRGPVSTPSFIETPNMPTVASLQKAIEDSVNFAFVKRGDGEEICMSGQLGRNCDMSDYTPELADGLRKAFVFLGFRQSLDVYVPSYRNQEVINMLLHHRENDWTALSLFYKTICRSSRKKVYVGPPVLEGVARMLKAEFVPVLPVNAFSEDAKVFEYLKAKMVPDAIVLFSAGMASKVWIARMIEYMPNATYIDVGSSFDPLFRSQSRGPKQATKEELTTLYAEIL